MKPKKFILEKINLILELFPDTRIKYEYNTFTHSHCVKILPFDFFKNDLGYLELENQIFDEFVNQFPTELLVFISEDSYYEFEDEILFDNSAKKDDKMQLGIDINEYISSYIKQIDFDKVVHEIIVSIVKDFDGKLNELLTLNNGEIIYNIKNNIKNITTLQYESSLLEENKLISTEEEFAIAA